MKIIDYINEYDSNLLTMDGFDHCILGVVEGIDIMPKVCYDVNKIIKTLEGYGMSYEEAVEWMEFNQKGAYVGDHTPIFLHSPDELFLS